MTTQPPLFLTPYRLLMATVACMIGIAWQSTQYAYFLPLFVIIFGVALAKAHLPKHKINVPLLAICLMIMCCGAGRYYQQQQAARAFYTRTNSDPCAVRAIVTSIDACTQKRYRQLLTLCIKQLKSKDSAEWQRGSYAVQLYSTKWLHVNIGDELEIQNLIFKPNQKKSSPTIL